MFTVYIIYSNKISRYYSGQTDNFNRRIKEHNSGQSKSTKSGYPWILVWSSTCKTRSQATKIEKQIKSRGAKRFLKDQIKESLFSI